MITIRFLIVISFLVFSLFPSINGQVDEDIPSGSGLAWLKIQQTGAVPSPRYWHSGVGYKKPIPNSNETSSELLVFGGWDNSNNYLGEVCKLLVDNVTWVPLNTNQNSDPKSIPFPRHLHGATVTSDSRYMIIFGGSNKSVVFDRTIYFYEIDLDAWVEHYDPTQSLEGWTAETLPAENNTWAPPPRQTPSIVYSALENTIIMFGGGDDTLKVLYSDVWKFNLTDKKWARMTPSGVNPAGRFGHSSAINPRGDKMWIYSGSNTLQFTLYSSFPEIFEYDVPNNAWKLLSSDSPRSLAGQTLSWTDYGFLLMLPFGLSTSLSSGNLPIGEKFDYNTTVKYFYNESRWDIVDTTDQKTVPSAGKTPAYVVWFSATVVGNKAIMFGGMNTSVIPTNDLNYILLNTVQPPKEVVLPKKEDHKKTIIIAVVVSVVGVGLIALVVAFFVVRGRRRRMRDTFYETELVNTSSVSILTLEESCRIKDVEIKERLGGGNFGDVYRGVWQGTTQVACKALKNANEIDDFVREATILKSLTHPNVVHFFGIFISDQNQKYIITEYLSLGSLNSVLSKERARLSKVDLIGMCQHVAAGMRYICEQKKLIHRDLALRNLLVTLQEGKYLVKIADLGLTRDIADKDFYQSSKAKIPIKWTAPEAIKYGKFTAKSDVWSFGIVMWEVFSFGSIPYYGMSNNETIEKVYSGYRMSAPDNMPTVIAEAMAKCWSMEPDERPSFKILYDSITRSLESEMDESKNTGGTRVLDVQQQVEEAESQDFYSAENEKQDNYNNNDSKAIQDYHNTMTFN